MKLKLSSLFLLILLSTLIISCKKEKKVEISEPVTVEELLDYRFIQVVRANATMRAKLGNHQIALYGSIVKDSEKTYMPIVYLHNNQYYKNHNLIGKIYNAQTGISTLNLYCTTVEVYKDKSGTLHLKKFTQNNNDDENYLKKNYDVEDVKLIKLNSRTYSDFMTYKSVTGESYYGFNFNTKTWLYKNTKPEPYETPNSTWELHTIGNVFWRGRDNGTAKYDNQFIVVSKGNGWNGEHKDKELILVNTLEKTSDFMNKTVAPMQVYELVDQ